MRRCFWSGMLLAGLGLAAPGCVSGPTGLAATYSGFFSNDLADDSPRLKVRSQREDDENTSRHSLLPPRPFVAPPIVLAAAQSSGPSPLLPTPPPLSGPPNTAGPAGPPSNQNSPPNLPGNYKVKVKAWVNGRPLFEEEFMQGLTQKDIQELTNMPAAQRAERLKLIEEKNLNSVIDQEVMYQDAVAKLEKGNPRALDKLKGLAHQEFEKQLKRIRETSKISEEQIRDLTRLLQRKMEREFISGEYMRSRVFPIVQKAIGPPEVWDYYQKHLNEFQKVEKVKWQDVFIAVGPKHPTVADAQRHAEELISRCRTVEDFEKLIVLDEGDSKFRNGEGLGSVRGDIRPPEVAEYLFKLRDNEIGPVVPLSTGVHIIRLVQREPGGQIPFNETIQLQIRNQLRNEVAEREFKHLIRVLRQRAVIEIEPD